MNQRKETHVLPRLRKRLTYANVMSSLAVFIALGGSSYAAYTINGASIKNRSISGKKLRHNTLTGVQIKESRLRRVPRAKTARAPAAYGSAVQTCMLIGTPSGPGRRLPTHGELLAAFSAVDPASGGELTSSVYPSSSAPGRLDVLFVTDKTGAVGLTPDTAGGSKAYRCV